MSSGAQNESEEGHKFSLNKIDGRSNAVPQLATDARPQQSVRNLTEEQCEELVLFEIVSAYGTVGLSLGYPGTNASLCAQFKVISKLIIVAMMLRGRHRGLPYALDRAILLPSENLHKKEAEEATRRHERRNSMFPESNNGDGESSSRSRSPEIRRKKTWEDGELDEASLPKQHLFTESVQPDAAGHAMGSSGVERKMTRGSGFSTVSKMERFQQERRHNRNLSLGRFVASGLGTGPTFSKHE